jgi:hypothetical protein
MVNEVAMHLHHIPTTGRYLSGVYLVTGAGISHKDSIITAIACKKRVQIECKPYYIARCTSINSMHF